MGFDSVGSMEGARGGRIRKEIIFFFSPNTEKTVNIAVLHKLNQLDKKKVETALKKKHNANLTLLKSKFYFF